MTTIDIASMAASHRQSLVDGLGDENAVLAATSPAAVAYCSGYRSLGYDTDPGQCMAVIFDADEWILVGPTSDLWAAQECGCRRYNGYGRFFFEDKSALSTTETEFASFDSFEQAVSAAISAFSNRKRRVAIEGMAGLETPGLSIVSRAEVEALFRRTRAVKDAAEIGLLRSVTKLTEAALTRAMAEARAGMTEAELAAIISSEMFRSGVKPGFIVVTSGIRSALADAAATLRPLTAGDLVRFDIGGTLNGYWSDTARTAIVGEPIADIVSVNAAIVAGQHSALAAVAPGVSADSIFQATVAAVRAAGLPSYQRHHVGHGIGLDSHEFPTLAPNNPTILQPGTVINVEAPYYRPLWGGIMYEDTLIVTETGVERFTTLDAKLTILPV
jgi:Xaa-Pro aminopeptidase